MIGHLGARVSALLDGQLSPADEERAWDHVHSCHQCRDAVEREGWVKTRLATMQLGDGATAPSHLKGSLLVRSIVDWPALSDHPALADTGTRRRHLDMTGIGSGAVGAAVMDRDRRSSGRGHDREHVPPAAHGPRRTLAP